MAENACLLDRWKTHLYIFHVSFYIKNPFIGETLLSVSKHVLVIVLRLYFAFHFHLVFYNTGILAFQLYLLVLRMLTSPVQLTVFNFAAGIVIEVLVCSCKECFL
ncbi:unnamed protein product [Musa textilis]